MTQNTKTPTIKVLNDYDGYFETRVKHAIAACQTKNIPMVDHIIINAGPYRNHCMSWTKTDNTVELDFYAANRVFGHEHSIQDICDIIKNITQ